MLAPLLTPKGTSQCHSLSYSTSDESSKHAMHHTPRTFCIHVTHWLHINSHEMNSNVRTGASSNASRQYSMRQFGSETDAQCLLLCLAALLGDDVSKLWEMAAGRSNSLDKMSKAPASDEQASTSWHRAGNPHHPAV